jgi:hypothetical protein
MIPCCQRAIQPRKSRSILGNYPKLHREITIRELTMAGADEVISKSFDVDVLIEKMWEGLDQASEAQRAL